MLGLPFTVREPRVPEALLPSPLLTVRRNALAKAKAVRGGPADFVVAADTIVVLDDRILGKPADLREAGRFLRLLSGRAHDVYTAVVLLHKGRAFTGVERTTVVFDRLTPAEIRRYLSLRPPLDKAGAYGIQDWAAVHVRRIEGDHFNVVGLPLNLLYRLLKRAGYPFHTPG